MEKRDAKVTSGRRQCAGFTLLEVLVALAILALALAAVVKAAGENASNAGYLRDKAFAHWVAMNKAAEIQISGQWPEPGSMTGRSPMGHQEWHWNATVSNTPDEALRRVEIEVRRESRDSDPLVTLTGFLARP